MNEKISLWKLDQEILHLPNVETQLVVWLDAVERKKASRCNTLHRSGFRLYLRKSSRHLDGVNMTTLDIASVFVKTQFQGRGWFTAFRTLAEALS